MRTEGSTWFSAEFERKGPAAICSARAIHVPRGAQLTALVEHRDRGDSSWTTLASVGIFADHGAAARRLTGIKDVLRIRVEAPGARIEQFEFSAPEPTWQKD